MDDHGIFSIDLLFATFMVLMIFLTMSNLILDRFNMVDESKELVEGRNLAESVAGAINQVYAGGDGHSVTIKMPPQINNNSNYRVVVNSSGVLVKLEGRRGLAYIIPERISSSSITLKSSTITLFPSKNYQIQNKKESNGDNWIVIKEE
jgi:hypothetical protein